MLFLLGKFDGADGGGRTHTLLRVPDFESSASANSATSALVCRKYIPVRTEVNTFCPLPRPKVPLRRRLPCNSHREFLFSRFARGFRAEPTPPSLLQFQRRPPGQGPHDRHRAAPREGVAAEQKPPALVVPAQDLSPLANPGHLRKPPIICADEMEERNGGSGRKDRLS